MYSLYLLNKSVLIKLLPLARTVLAPHLGAAGWLVAYGLYWGQPVGALLLYTYVEVPFMRLREGFEKPRAAAPTTELAAAGPGAWRARLAPPTTPPARVICHGPPPAAFQMLESHSRGWKQRNRAASPAFE